MARIVRKASSVVSLALLLLAAGCSSGKPARASCTPPRGPGDDAVHSGELRVQGVRCSAGRAVALACTPYTYGRSGTCAALGSRWRCTSTKPPGSASRQRCVSGRKSVTILWTD